jgi:hypothetical protein
MNTYRSEIVLDEYMLFDSEGNVYTFDQTNLKLGSVKNLTLFLIRKETEFKVLEIHLADSKKR